MDSSSHKSLHLEEGEFHWVPGKIVPDCSQSMEESDWYRPAVVMVCVLHQSY